MRDEEYEKICRLLGREPNEVELGMFAVLWSEHCAYKHSRALLGRLPSQSDRLLLGPGENAGVVDVGPVAIAFRIESHNHPTAVAPYQGAATGAGGIIRDILAVGAQPAALLASVRFGDPQDEKVRRLFRGAITGLADYGNRAGVPAVGGEAVFEPVYRDNPLVNVLCIGILPKQRLTRARASGVGNALIMIGAPTGRDGILAASFASDELPGSEVSDQQVPTGDPDVGRWLIGACLELLQQPGVVGIQDMGAAGITSSVAETASRAGNGAVVDVSRVPRRDLGMNPYEVMLSESQERMLIVVERGREAAVEAVAAKWGLSAAVIGRVTDDGLLTVRDGHMVVAQVPVRSLTDEAPRYSTPSRRPAYIDQVPEFNLDAVAEPTDWPAALRSVLASPNIAFPTWARDRFTSPTALVTISAPGDEAVVFDVPGAGSSIAVAVRGNGRYCWLDPHTGAAHAVAEASRHVVCTGAEPLAITNGLNLGNPEKGDVYWQLERVIDGMAAACRALQLPVSGGNVSLYNETAGEPVYPTPIVGVLGRLARPEERIPPTWHHPDLFLAVLGDDPEHLGGSEYLLAAGLPVHGPVPHLDLEMERRVQSFMGKLHGDGRLRAARAVGAGGLLTAVVKMASRSGIGAQLSLESVVARPDVHLFGEGGSRIIVAVEADAADIFAARAREHGVPWRPLGQTGGDRLRVTVGGQTLFDEPLSNFVRVWHEGLERLLPCRA